jgi:hypothetical protein
VSHLCRRYSARAVHHFLESKNGVKLVLELKGSAQPRFQGNETRMRAGFDAPVADGCLVTGPSGPELHDARAKIDHRFGGVHNKDEQHRPRAYWPQGFALTLAGLQDRDVEDELRKMSRR